MKKFYKYMIPCVALALSLTSCNSTMDDKAAIDAQYENLDDPTIAMGTAIAASYETAVATGSLSDVENVQEVGFQVSADETFTTSENYPSETVAANFTAELTGLSELSTYYVRAFVFTKTGKTFYSEATTFTTPEAQIFDVIGSYTAIDYELSDEMEFEPGTPYTVTIAFADGSDTEVEISNLWNGGETIMGVYDPESSTITVPTGQLLYDDPDYGDVTAMALNDDITDYQDDIVFTFKPVGGTMVSGFIQALIVNLGASYGIFYVDLKHNPDNSSE